MDPQEMSLQDDFLMGEWRVQPALLQLRGPKGTVRLEPRAMSLLVVLSQHAGQVVSRQRLHELAWADATVSDETVNRTVFDLRKVLGDRASAPRFIETIRKVGYRLVAPVEPVSAPPPARSLARTVDRRVGWVIATAALLGLSVVGLSVVIAAGRSSPGPRRSEPVEPRHRQLTSLPGYETHPAVSADGSRLAFAWDGGGTDNVDIYWRELHDPRRPVRLTDGPGRDEGPAFSPTGDRLAFVRSGDGGCQLMVAELPLAASSSTEPAKVAQCREAAVSPPIWSADGRSLIFADRDTPGEPFRLRRLDLDSGDSTTLSAPPFGSLGDLYPALSPSGRRLAFVRASAKSTISTYLSPAIGDLWVLDLGQPTGPGGSPPLRRLTDDNRVIAGLTWTAGGDELIYAARRDARGYALWRVPSAGGEPSLLSAPRGLLRFPRRAGEHRIAYERWEGQTDVWREPLGREPLGREPLGTEPLGTEPLARAGSEAGRRIQWSTRSDLNPSWSPDGERFAFTSERTGNYEIWTSRADGEAAVQLTDFTDAPAESPAWSPDGMWIAFEANRDGRSHLYLVDANGESAPRQLTSTPFDDRSPTWSLDSRRLYFGSNRSGSWQLWQLHLDRGKAVQITRSGAFRGRESSHTEPPTLLYAKRDGGGIWRADETAGEQLVGEQLVAELAPEHWGNWDVVDGTLYTVELLNRSTRIRSLELATGEARIAGVVEGWISREAPNLAVDSGRASVLMARFSGLAADLMMVESRSD